MAKQGLCTFPANEAWNDVSVLPLLLLLTGPPFLLCLTDQSDGEVDCGALRTLGLVFLYYQGIVGYSIYIHSFPLLILFSATTFSAAHIFICSTTGQSFVHSIASR